MRTRCKRGLILRKRQVILTPWGLDPRILCDTSTGLWTGYKSLDGYLSAVRHELVLYHGSLPGAFGSHFRRVKRAAARENVGRRSRRQLCRSCAPPSSATPWLHWS